MDRRYILDFFNFRYACKIFDKEKTISEDDFNVILEAGRLSPSSFGFEPWKFLVIQDKNLRKKLLDFTWGAKDSLLTASHYVIILARKKSMHYDSDYIFNLMRKTHKLPEDKAIKRKEKYKNFQLYDFKLLESDRALFDWACKQTYIALANMMSVAAMLKIDSCAIEGFNRDLSNDFLKNELSIDTDEFEISVMVAFGYRLNPQPAKTRQKLEDIVTYYKGEKV